MKSTQNQDRSSRAAESRENEVHEVAEKPWIRPSSLEAPKPEPGMVQRWIRVGVMGKDDPVNLMRKLREGWVPRMAETAPPDFPVPRIEHGKYAGAIGVEGMILMQMPIATAEQRNRHFRMVRDRQTAAINHQLERDSAALSGRGFGPIEKDEKSLPVREVKVADDGG